MSEVPGHLKYTNSHEWLRVEGDGEVIVGITDHAQAALGDLVFVELPEIDQELKAGNSCAVVESVKAASDVYCPIAGRVIAVNEHLTNMPQLVNQQPYADGWLYRLTLADDNDLNQLLSADEYGDLLNESS